MLLNTRGIVLHAIKYGETSIICKMLTEDLGMQSFIVNGVRTSKSKWKTNLFQHLQPLEMVIYYKEGRNIHRISEASPMIIFTEIPFSIRKSTYVMFIAEVLYRSIPAEIHAENLFELVLKTVNELESKDERQHILFRFLIELSACLGFNPQIRDHKAYAYFDLREGCFMSHEPKHPDYLNQIQSRFLAHFMLPEISAGEINSELKHEVLLKLLTYYRIHLKDFSTIRSSRLISPEFFVKNVVS